VKTSNTHISSDCGCYVVDEMCVVTFAGYVHKPHRVLKPAEEFRWRQWHVRSADGIAASVEQRAMEDVGISEGASRRATREPPEKPPI